MKIRVFLFTAAISAAAVAQVQIRPAQDVQIQAPGAENSAVAKLPVQVRNTDELRPMSEAAPEMTPRAYEQRSRIPVKMISLSPQGTARLVGSVRGLGMDVYQFSGNAGDVIRIVSAKATAMEFAIFSPEMGMRFGNYQVLPYTGMYELRIVNNRKDSARNRKPRPYDVTFTLERPQSR